MFDTKIIKASQRSPRKDIVTGELDFKNPSLYDLEVVGKNHFKGIHKTAVTLNDGAALKKGTRVVIGAYSNNGKVFWELFQNNEPVLLILERSIFEKYFVKEQKHMK